MDNEQKWGKHYNTHSLYGHSMAIVTHKTLEDLFPDRRSFVLTRSQFAGTGKYAGHWLGDNQSHWPNLGWSIIGMLEYSLFGFSYTGRDHKNTLEKDNLIFFDETCTNVSTTHDLQQKVILADPRIQVPIFAVSGSMPPSPCAPDGPSWARFIRTREITTE